jgi:thiamine biosynthesis lipoprotein
MRPYLFEAMGTSWWLCSDSPDAHRDAEALVRDVERRLSRFDDASALSTLNRDRSAVDPVLADVTRVALRFTKLTSGAFDPGVGATVSALGYDRTFEAIDRPVAGPAGSTGLTVDVSGDRVSLHGDGKLDLGGLAKGWTVDRVIELLRDVGATKILVDGGGDLRGEGHPWPVGIGEGEVVELDRLAVATSSTCRRRWQTHRGEVFHHIIDPATGRSASSGVDTVAVVAADAVTADALATALLVDPSATLEVAARLGSRTLVRDLGGRWWTTSAFEGAA